MNFATSIHITREKNLLNNFKSSTFFGIYFTITNKVIISIFFKTTIVDNKVLFNIVYWFGLYHNLIFVGKLKNNGYFITFISKSWTIYNTKNPNHIIFFVVHDQHNILYKLHKILLDFNINAQLLKNNYKTSHTKLMHLAITKVVEINEVWYTSIDIYYLWHKRFNHFI